MGIKKIQAGALHGAMRGNLRQNRDRRYAEAVERQAKYNDKHGGINLCAADAVHSPNCPCKEGAAEKVIECTKPVKKARKRQAKVTIPKPA